jgi:hypothetical protein
MIASPSGGSVATLLAGPYSIAGTLCVDEWPTTDIGLLVRDATITRLDERSALSPLAAPVVNVSALHLHAVMTA